VFTLLAGFLMTACDEENDPAPAGEDPTGEVGDDGDGSDDDGSGNGGAGSTMYFPGSGTEWETASAVDLGWDTTDLSEAIRYAKEKNSYNLLIIHKGRMISENYWKGTDVTTQHDLNSVAKSMMGVVIGILQQDGTISIDDKVSDYLAAGWSQSPNTEADITIRHLLTMTSGLNENLGYVGSPGETWRYSHAAYKVLYDVIGKATGKSYRDLFDDLLFSKIGMTNYSWSGRDVVTSGRELARFGLMMLNDGVWDGNTIIADEEYFSAMLNTSQSIQQAYGYLWWLNGKGTWYDDEPKVTVNGFLAPNMPADGWLAKGKHDQRIYVVPSQDLVVIRQGGYTALPESGEGSFDAEFWKRLMAAIE
jgi:CubicO group peptidase (beta-lactamase class C family)